MFRINRRRLWAMLLAAACFALTTAPLHAQIMYGGVRGVPRAGYVGAGHVYPTYGYYGAYGDPYGGYLQGAASVINAQGGYLKDVQDAYLKKEQVKAAQISNKRLAFDEWRYEKENTPTLEEQREEERIQNVLRSRNNPPATEIWSGKALNDLLQDLQQQGAAGGHGPPVYLNQDLLKEVNVTVGTTTAGMGVLKNAGKLQWPLALQADVYATTRTNTEMLAAAAIKQAQAGSINAKTLMDLIASVGKLQDQLKSNAASTEPNQYIKSKRYLNDLDGSVKTLQDANVKNYVSGQWSAQGNTVAELVQYMTAQGLKFAPATPGDEAAYNSVHRALAGYQTAMAPTEGSKKQ